MNNITNFKKIMYLIIKYLSIYPTIILLLDFKNVNGYKKEDLFGFHSQLFIFLEQCGPISLQSKAMIFHEF